MIISELNGGLGNQMFQYALGRTLSLKHNTELLFDISLYENQSFTDTKRSFELYVFDVPGKIAGKKVLKKWLKPNKYLLVFNSFLNLGLNHIPKNYIKENGHEFHPEILNLPDDIYLSGYWQSEKYFKNIRKVLIEDFTKRISVISSENNNLASAIINSESVSIHVRRTDYVNNKNSNAFHGVCNLNYYLKAMHKIEAIAKHPHYFVFSDDPLWVKENIKSIHPMTYISHNTGKSAHEDIRLMAKCKHNIIANSSFSWWGAWLNENPNKIVIAPSKWFSNKDVYTSDIYSEKWIKI